jgi:hypothetical protein
MLLGARMPCPENYYHKSQQLVLTFQHLFRKVNLRGGEWSAFLSSCSIQSIVRRRKMKHNDKSRVHRFLLQSSICNSKASLTSQNHIPKRQYLQAATIKYQSFETQNYLLSGNQTPWDAGSFTSSPFICQHHHTQTEALQVKWKEKIQQPDIQIWRMWS